MTLPTPHPVPCGGDAALNPALLDREYSALLVQYGRVQQRCTEALAAQARRIATLEAELVRLRATRIIQDTALAQQREAHEALIQAAPGLPRRAALARHVDALLERVRDLLAERQGRQLRQKSTPPEATQNTQSTRENTAPIFWSQPPHRTALKPAGAQHILHLDGSGSDNDTALESSLAAADLVICQVACISHNAYWRVQDHCKRTGKTCVLVHPPGVKAAAGHTAEVA